MELALSTFLFYEMPLAYAVAEIAKLGFSLFELSHPVDMSAAETEELNAAQEEHGIRASSVHMPVRRPAHPEGMAACERVIEFAESIGAGCVVTHVDEERLADRGDAYLADVAALSRRARDAGLTYTVENVREPLVDLERVVNAGPEIGFTLDVQHAAHHPDERDPWVYVRKFGGRLANVHVLAATRRILGQGHGVPPGFETEEEFEWSRLAAELRDLDYDGPVTVEHNLSRLTQTLMMYLPMLREVLKDRTEMAVIPLHTDFGSGEVPQEILASDATPLKLVYDPDAAPKTHETTLEHVLAAYSRRFFEDVFALKGK